MTDKEFQDYVLEAVEVVVRERFKEFISSNYYIEASIVSDNSNGTYNIEYNDQTLPNIKAREGLTLALSDIVLVCIVNGNFSNKFIDLKRP